jgi:hypothetical protein
MKKFLEHLASGVLIVFAVFHGYIAVVELVDGLFLQASFSALQGMAVLFFRHVFIVQCRQIRFLQQCLKDSADFEETKAEELEKPLP